jgi:hypothetical protein
MPLVQPVLHLNRNLTATQELILGSNPQRYYVLIVNDSDSTAYISLGKPAVANEGIRLNASGGSFEINLTNPYYGEIYAVSTGASKKLMITEISKEGAGVPA